MKQSKSFGLVLFAVLGVIAGSEAHASRARNSVMFGNGGAGSYYYDDAYNIFYNPSYVNDFKNWGIIEKSNGVAGNAMGGFVSSFMNMNVGVYLNRSGVTATTPGYSGMANPIEIMVGSDTGVKWGVGVSYAAADKQTDANITVGAQLSGLEPFASFRLMGDNNTNDASKVKQTDFSVGTRYKWGEWVPYAVFTSRSTSTAGTTPDSAKNTAFTLGFGRNTKLTDGVMLNYALTWTANKNADQSGYTTSVPLVMSVEGDVTSWLTLRSGMSYTTSATGARIGGTFHIGKLDWNFAAGSSTTGIDADNIGFNEGLLAQSSLTYRW